MLVSSSGCYRAGVSLTSLLGMRRANYFCSRARICCAFCAAVGRAKQGSLVSLDNIWLSHTVPTLKGSANNRRKLHDLRSTFYTHLTYFGILPTARTVPLVFGDTRPRPPAHQIAIRSRLTEKRSSKRGKAGGLPCAFRRPGMMTSIGPSAPDPAPERATLE